MIFVNMPDLEKGFELSVVDLIRRVLENRADVAFNEDFIFDVAHYTIEKTRIGQLIAESNILHKPTAEIHEEYKLSRIIEFLAIVNRAIDVVSHRKKSIDVFPG